jgi:hypothetical protein
MQSKQLLLECRLRGEAHTHFSRNSLWRIALDAAQEEAPYGKP